VTANASELDDLRAYVAELEERVRDRDRRLAVMSASSSWRMTRPLRDLAARVRGRALRRQP